MKKLLLLTFFATLALNSFSQTKKTLNSWLGSEKKTLIQSWGLPEKQGDDGDGGEILQYRTSDMRGTKYTSFYIDRNKKVYKWTTNPIPPTQVIIQPNNRW